MSNWIKALEETNREQLDTVPAGFKTREQIQKHFKLGEAQTLKILRKMLAAGKIEVRSFRIRPSHGPIPHYKAK